MGDMIQSSSRVKLNRVALKEVVGVKVAPRRRKVSQSRTDSTKEEDPSMLEDPGCKKPPRGVLSHRKAADTGRASSMKPPSDNNWTNSPGPAGLESSVRRSNGSFDTAVCQDSKHSPPSWKNGSKWGVKRLSSDPGQGKPKNKRTTAKGSEETELWKSPNVVVCDIAKSCGTCRHGCGLILPKSLKNKAVHCFKQAMLTGKWFLPGCAFDDKRKEQTRSSTARRCLSVVLDGKKIRQDSNEEVCDRQMPLRHASALIYRNFGNQDATAAAALSSMHEGNGNRSKDTCSDGAGPVSHQTDARAHKKIKLGESSLFILSGDWTAKENGASLNLCEKSSAWTEQHGAQVPSEPICEENYDDIPESFTCQRVNVYTRKVPYSCARTNIPWPFGKGHLSSHGVLASSSSEGVDLSASDSVTENANQTGSSSSRSSTALQEAPLDKQEGGDGKAAIPCVGSTNGLRLDPKTTGDGEKQTPPSLDNGLERVSSGITSSTAAFSPPTDTSTQGHPSPIFLPFSSFLSENAEDGLKAGDKSVFHCKPSQLSAWSSLSSFTSDNLDSSHSGESSLPFPQDEDQMDKSLPGKPVSKGNSVHLKNSFLCGFLKAGCMKTDTNQFILPILLSPVASPHTLAWRKNCEGQSSRSSDEEEQTKDNHSCPERHRLQNQTEQHSSCSTSPGKARSSHWRDKDEREGKEGVSDEHEQAVGLAEEDASDSKTKSPAGSSVQTDAQPHSGEEDPSVLDEITAYEHDILLVDLFQDDPELFVDPPKQSRLRLGPARGSVAPKKTAPAAARVTFAVGGTPGKMGQSPTSVRSDLCSDGWDAAEESDSRPWRPRCSSTTPPNMQNACPAPDEHSRHVVQLDVNNNHHADGVYKRIQPIQTVSSSLLSAGTGPRVINAAGGSEFRRQKSNSYCRQYFSESLSCGFKMCRFQHLPVEGDEKFCVEAVMRFIKNPACLQKAGVVFTGYYHSSPPGVYFSMQMLLSLLWALLKAGMVSDIFSVLRVSLAHNIVPSHEFLLDLFNFVREKSLTGFVPELMQLTFKMASVGLELSLDCLDCVKNMPLFQQTVHPHPAASASPHLNAPLPDCLNLAHAVVEVELCTKQEDWKRMGKVFCSICQSSYHPSQVERISGRITIALLSESKDKLSLPFAAFVETVFQSGGEGSLVKNFVGRIGVSLMLRYHKTHQWLKGRAVVEIMSAWKVSYTTMKGLFGNEDGASRCSLVTVATELFLLSGSVEGALNTLRENAWFLSTCSWPCDPSDLDNRTRVLKHLAEKTSHRDTLEVLCNLPGIKDATEHSDISKHTLLFNSHLQACVDRQILPVASDTVDFMLSKKLAIDHTLLQTLLHKLGKQNLWLRAREVFRHSLKAGHYPGVCAPPDSMTLVIPCGLGEVEQVLALEMFVTVNASLILRLPDSSSSALSITLTRSDSCESEYLSAGSRLLTAACILQPKLTVHYTAVNSSQEQVFKLDVTSARRWLRHNHLWANEVWAH